MPLNWNLWRRLAWVVPVLAVSCVSEPEVTQAPITAAPPAEVDPANTDPDMPVILAYGDSLTAGHMVDRGVSYPSQLQEELNRLGFRYRVVNQGISGDTTSGGIARLSSALALQPKLVVLELGANDGLRGVPIDLARENLGVMIEEFKAVGAQVILAGLTLPRNYGPDYIREFESMYVDLAEQHQVGRIPFFLEGLVGDPALMQSDGVHPTGEGYTIVAANVLEAILPYLEK